MQPTSRQVPPSFGCFSIERGLQSVLAGADGSGVAAGTTPDDDQIVRHFFYSTYDTGTGSRCVFHFDMKRLLPIVMLACACGFAQAGQSAPEGRAERPPAAAPAAQPKRAIASIAVEGNQEFTREQVLAVRA